MVLWFPLGIYLELLKSFSKNSLLYLVVLLVVELNPMVLLSVLLPDIHFVFCLKDSFVLDNPYVWSESIILCFELALTGVLVEVTLLYWLFFFIPIWPRAKYDWCIHIMDIGTVNSMFSHKFKILDKFESIISDEGYKKNAPIIRSYLSMNFDILLFQ